MYADDAIEIVKKNNGAILHERYGKQADTAFELDKTNLTA